MRIVVAAFVCGLIVCVSLIAQDGLSDETYANLVAYVLQVNGYAAGETALTTGDGTTLR